MLEVSAPPGRVFCEDFFFFLLVKFLDKGKPWVNISIVVFVFEENYPIEGSV